MKLPPQGLAIHEVTVGPDWLDYNDHMNVAYYLKAFDDAGEGLSRLAGMGPDYERATGCSWVALESHITFQQEARRGDALRILSRIIGVDAKKIHVCQEMYRGDELLATHEQLGLHFDTRARRSSPFAPDILRNFMRLLEAQQPLGAPPWLGRAVALKQNRPDG